MKELLETRLRQRVAILYRYTHAMESGDTDMIAVVLAEAQHDSVLERMLLEVNEVYQIEDRTVAHPDDVVTAQEILLTAFTAHTTDDADSAAPSRVAAPSHIAEPLHLVEPLRVGAPLKATRPTWYRSRISWLLGAVAAILIVLLILPGAGALADQFLSLFQVQQFQPVPTVERPDQLLNNVALLLRNFGTVQWGNGSDSAPTLTLTTSNNIADATKLVDFQPQLPTTLPAGVGHVPQFSISSGEDVTFTFDQAKTASYLQTTGQSSVPIPTSLTGAQFHITLSNGLAVVYYDHCDAPAQDGTQHCTSGSVNLALGEIPSPVITAEGNASFSDLRTFLLALPKLSPDLHNLIEHTDVNSGILPVPIPSGIDAQQVSVKGVQGLLLSYGSANLILWQDHGLVYLITAYGTDNTQLLNTANSLNP